ncbi:MAG: VCBS repeat-containing protein [Phycisphaerales bacterium]
MGRALACALACVALAVPLAGTALAQPCPPDEIFGVRRLALVGEEPRALAVADLDNDGDLDVIVVNNGGDSISIGLNDGEGRLGRPTEYPVPRPGTAAAGDFDGDGDMDVAVTLGTGGVQIMENQGDGFLVEAGQFIPGVGLFSLVSADFDGDGWPDLAGIDRLRPAGVNIFRNDRAGGFEEGDRYIIPDGFRLVAEDLDRDGTVDVAVALGFSGVQAFLNFGNGRMVPMPRIEPTDLDVAGFGIGDVTGDGAPEMLLGAFGLEFGVLTNDGQGAFDRTPLLLTAGSTIRHLAAGDFNGDCLNDIVVAEPRDNTVGLLLQDAAGGFGPVVRTPVQVEPEAMIVADFNNDGAADVLVANRQSNTVSLLINTCAAARPCRADLDCSGALELGDFLAFQNLFDAGDPKADFDGDGSLTIFDFLAFTDAFQDGC